MLPGRYATAEQAEASWHLPARAEAPCSSSCQSDRKFNRIDRVRGEFVKPEQDTSEPERTERLLAHPYRLFHAHAGDAIDSNKLLWLNRASGSYGAVGVFYEFILLLVQLCIGVLTGLGPSIEPGSQAAYNQMGTVLTLQYACTARTATPSARADCRYGHWRVGMELPSTHSRVALQPIASTTRSSCASTQSRARARSCT